MSIDGSFIIIAATVLGIGLLWMSLRRGAAQRRPEPRDHHNHVNTAPARDGDAVTERSSPTPLAIGHMKGRQDGRSE
jgi:hypothetical protein